MKTVLIIEDNPDIRENACEMLELKGYKAIFAENGQIGIDLAKLEKPDIILCDIIMPEVDGYNVFIALKKDPNTANIPFIFLTASIERKTIESEFGKGADGYIRKPFEDTEFFDTIAKCLKEK